MRPRTFTALTGVAAVACTLAITAPAQAQQSDGSPSASGTSPPLRQPPRPEERRAGAEARQGPDDAHATARRSSSPRRVAASTVTLTAPDGSEEAVYFAGATQRRGPQTDKVFTILAEFGTEGSGQAGHRPRPAAQRDPGAGPPQDNSTYWVEDFSKSHYEDMFNSDGRPSFKDFYLKQSGGRYTAVNTVSDWVQVPGNAVHATATTRSRTSAARGRSSPTPADAWYDAQLPPARPPTRSRPTWPSSTSWDRYDFDGDGDFNEPDGYLDHFQAVHAGGGEEAGGAG